MYLSMVISLCISVLAIDNYKMAVLFLGDILA